MLLRCRPRRRSDATPIRSEGVTVPEPADEEPLVDGPLVRPYMKSEAYERDIRWLMNRRNQPYGLRGMRVYDVIHEEPR
jgi:hypothetical protein